MPLNHSKSKAAFKHNISAEVNAGKPMKQALAIAYSMKRKKYAKGGIVEDDNEKMDGDPEQFLSAEEGSESPFQDAEGASDEEELDESEFNSESKMDNTKGDSDQDESRSDTLRRIMSKVRKQHMGR